jgi:type I restriction enzyme, S subunit
VKVLPRSGTRPLASCGTLLTGGTPSRAKPAFWNGSIPWISAKSLKQFDLVDSEDRVTESGAKTITTVPAGSVLFVVRGMSLAKEFRVGVAARPVTFNQDLRALVPGENIDGRYLARFLQAHTAQVLRLVDEASHGTKRLTSDRFESIPVPVPALSEQRRIATILDKADALRAKRRSALAKLDTLAESIFLSMFAIDLDGPAVDVVPGRSGLRAGWSWEPLTDVARLATGHTPDRERSEYWNGSIPWISLTDIRDLDGTVATQTTQTVTPLGIDNSSAVLLPEGTVCFSRTASVGFVTVMGREMSTSQDFVNWICGPRLDPTYLMWALRGARRRLQALSSGSTHKTIYVRVVEQFRALVPPIDLQRRFASSIRALRTVELAQDASLAGLDTLVASLQHHAFTGNL